MGGKLFIGESLRSKSGFLLAILFIYVVLFEFILPANRILPMPHILFESFLYIWDGYNIIQAIAITSTIVYSSLVVSYFIIQIFAGRLIKFSVEYPGSIEKLKIFRYFPAFFFAIIFAYWFEDSIVAEFLFGLLSSLLLIAGSLLNSSRNFNKTYFDAGLNMNMSRSEVYSKIVFKEIQPVFFSDLFRIHYYLWILVMIYEFICGIEGFGGIYKTALSYKDFAGLFSIAVVISILILIGNSVIKYIDEKIFFWEE